MDPGLSMGDNNLDVSSNHGAGDAGHGLGINDLADFFDPRKTINHSLSTTPVHSRSVFSKQETRMKQTPSSGPPSPSMLETPATVATCTSYIQQSSPNSLLQVPRMHNIHSTPPSPSVKPFPQLGNPDGSNLRGSLSRRNTKSKPLASAKKAEEVSEELATKIAKFIDLYRGPPKDIQATIKNQLLLTFNPGLSRKRRAQMASLNDDSNSTKKRLIACDQCPTTTARQCDMRYVHH